jgi:hypothetical protein
MMVLLKLIMGRGVTTVKSVYKMMKVFVIAVVPLK